MHTTTYDPSMSPPLTERQRRNMHGAVTYFLGSLLFLLVFAALV